jgi:hypothetical protein
VQRSSRLRCAEDQAARAVFIVGIVLDNLASSDRLSCFGNADLSKDGPIHCLPRKLEGIGGFLSANVIDGRHA